jgi:hypothetical protein
MVSSSARTALLSDSLARGGSLLFATRKSSSDPVKSSSSTYTCAKLGVSPSAARSAPMLKYALPWITTVGDHPPPGGVGNFAVCDASASAVVTARAYLPRVEDGLRRGALGGDLEEEQRHLAAGAAHCLSRRLPLPQNGFACRALLRPFLAIEPLDFVLAAADGVREVHRGETAVPPLGRAPVARLVDCRSPLSGRLSRRACGFALLLARCVSGGTFGISCRRKPLGFRASLL